MNIRDQEMLFQVIIHDREKPVYIMAESEAEIISFMPSISKDKYIIEQVDLIRAPEISTFMKKEHELSPAEEKKLLDYIKGL